MSHVQIKQSEIETAYQHIKAGGLAVIPSRVGYTLLGNSEQAIAKMYAIKGRPLTKPCVVLTRHDVLPDIALVPRQHQKFIDTIHERQLLCGFICQRKPHALFSTLSGYTDRNSQKPDGTSCFVIHGGDYLQYLIDRSLADGTVIVGSSANKSGTGNEGEFANIPSFIKEAVEYALEHDEYVQQDYNPVTREQGVMVNLTGDQGFIIRAGFHHDEIEALLTEHNASVAN